MKVTDTTPVGAVDRIAGGEAPAAVQPKDKVDVRASRDAQASVASARSAASNNRISRLKEIEQQVRSGGYQPNPSQVADEILQAAEVDAKLREMIGH
ncbi:MAG TPA: flagellar biosynthesis anti-sigma factor FlgM [Polyangia bacterium]|jgi:negative regulator of flagellin synthesis FlgM|nr:flagellar biosynthesis anti-sigma factor FlgM [Polyangia bacterium]